MQAEPNESKVADRVRQPLQTGSEHKALAPRSAAAKRRAMQGAMAAAVMDLRSDGGRRIGWRRPPGGLN